MCNRNVSPHAHGNGEEDDRSPSTYLEQTVFSLLLPALKETFATASEWNALRVQKCRFNGLDFIAEILWNHNPRRSKRYSPRLNVFEIPEFKQWLRECPRPFYPKSWLWSESEAALHLQRYVRGWLVRKRADVQEMREFWKKWAASDVGQQETSRMYLSSYSKAFVYDAKVIISDECALRFDTELRQIWDNGKKYRWLQEIPFHVLCQVQRLRTSNERYLLNPRRNCRVHTDESFGLDYLRSFEKCLTFIQLQG